MYTSLLTSLVAVIIKQHPNGYSPPTGKPVIETLRKTSTQGDGNSVCLTSIFSSDSMFPPSFSLWDLARAWQTSSQFCFSSFLYPGCCFQSGPSPRGRSPRCRSPGSAVGSEGWGFQIQPCVLGLSTRATASLAQSFGSASAWCPCVIPMAFIDPTTTSWTLDGFGNFESGTPHPSENQGGRHSQNPNHGSHPAGSTSSTLSSSPRRIGSGGSRRSQCQRSPAHFVRDLHFSGLYDSAPERLVEHAPWLTNVERVTLSGWGVFQRPRLPLSVISLSIPADSTTLLRIRDVILQLQNLDGLSLLRSIVVAYKRMFPGIGTTLRGRFGGHMHGPLPL